MAYTQSKDSKFAMLYEYKVVGHFLPSNVHSILAIQFPLLEVQSYLSHVKMSNSSELTGLLPSPHGNASLIENNDLCTLSLCDLTLAHVDYLPSLPGNALFAALFGICLIAQLFLGIKYRTWGYMAASMLGMVTEVIGYIGRVMMHSNPFNDSFLLYLVTLTIAPAFLTAAIYLCLARIVVVYGEEWSRFKPRTYTILFCTCDFLALLLQAAGGAIASGSNSQSSVSLSSILMKHTR
jgi:hypothetical protein